MSMNRLPPTSVGFGESQYPSAAPPTSGSYAPTSAAGYDTIGYAPAPVRHAAYGLPSDSDPRRFSQTSVHPAISCLLYAVNKSFSGFLYL